MSIDATQERIKQKLGLIAGLDAAVLFDFGDDGIIHIDATVNPPVISRDHKEADVVFITSLKTFDAIMNGAQDPTMAFMMGKLKIKGSMGLAMKLNSILEE